MGFYSLVFLKEVNMIILDIVFRIISVKFKFLVF